MFSEVFRGFPTFQRFSEVFRGFQRLSGFFFPIFFNFRRVFDGDQNAARFLKNELKSWNPAPQAHVFHCILNVVPRLRNFIRCDLIPAQFSISKSNQ